MINSNGNDKNSNSRLLSLGNKKYNNNSNNNKSSFSSLMNNSSQSQMRASSSMSRLSKHLEEKKSYLSINPSEVVFELNCQEEQQQQQTIELKNISNQPYKIKLSSLLQSKYFHIISLEGSLDDNITTVIAPGLSKKLIIGFNCNNTNKKKEEQYQEEELTQLIKISSELFTEEISLRACCDKNNKKYSHQIEYDDKIDLGYIQINRPTRFSHSFYNESDKDQMIISLSKSNTNVNNNNNINNNNLFTKTVTATTETLIIHQQQQFVIKPLCRENVEFTLTPMKEGANNIMVGVKNVSNNNIMLKEIEICYVASDMGCWLSVSNRTLIDDNSVQKNNFLLSINKNKEEHYFQKVNDINFNYQYLGKEQKLTLFAVNNTPFEVEMKSKIRLGCGWGNNKNNSDVTNVNSDSNNNNNKVTMNQYQSPEEYGLECMSTTVDIKPKVLMLKPFTKEKFTLISKPNINDLHEAKVVKYMKSVGEQRLVVGDNKMMMVTDDKNNSNNIISSSEIKNDKKILETMMEKYKIEDEEFEECLVTEFSVFNNKISNNNYNNNNNNNNKPPITTKNNNTTLSNLTNLPTLPILLLTPIKSIYTLPKVKLHPTEIYIKDKITIGNEEQIRLTIKNDNLELPCKLVFSKVLGVEIMPKEIELKPLQERELKVVVKPVSIGVVNELMRVIVEERFVVEIRVVYEGAMMVVNNNVSNSSNIEESRLSPCASIKQESNFFSSSTNKNKSSFVIKEQRKQKLHNSLHENFTKPTNDNNAIMIDNSKIEKSKNSNNNINNHNSKQKNNHNEVYFMVEEAEQQEQQEQKEQQLLKRNLSSSSTSGLFNIRKGKYGANNYSNNNNNNNNKSINEDIVKTVNNVNNNKNNNKAKNNSNPNKEEMTQYETHTEPTKTLHPSPIGLPSATSPLYVTKKIDNYQPYPSQTTSTIFNSRKLLKSKTSKEFFSSFGSNVSSPSSSMIMRKREQTTMELKGEELRKIRINTSSITFGKVFIGSIVEQEFIVSNETDNMIEVVLKQSNNGYNTRVLAESERKQQQEKEQEMLKHSDFGIPQILPPNSSGRFRVILNALQCGCFKETISYVINTHHEFKLLVEAEIELASLVVSKNLLKMGYSENGDVINNSAINSKSNKADNKDKDDDMTLRECFSLRNEGNADVEYMIEQQSNERRFLIQPETGVVRPNESIQINLSYIVCERVINAGESNVFTLVASDSNDYISLNNSMVSKNNLNKNMGNNRRVNNNNSNVFNNQSSSSQTYESPSFFPTNKPTPQPSLLISKNFQEEKVLVSIKNGITIPIKVTFTNPNITEPKCIIKEQRINFATTIVNKPKTKSFLLKNLSRTMTLFEIKNLPKEYAEYFQFDLIKGKLQPESTKELFVTFKSSKIQRIETSFNVVCRGGLVINVPIVVESVAPNVRLLEKEYDFGNVYNGSRGVVMVNVCNESETGVEMWLDMRKGNIDNNNNNDIVDTNNKGMEYLFVSLIGGEFNNNNKKKSEKKRQKSEKKQIKQLFTNITSTQTLENNLEPEQKENEHQHHQQLHKLTIQPKSIYKFYLIYKPKRSGYYEFELPLYLENFIKNETLERIVKCNVIEPVFVIEPKLVRFKKVVINEDDKNDVEEGENKVREIVVLKNLSGRELKWKMVIPRENVMMNKGNNSNDNLEMNEQYDEEEQQEQQEQQQRFPFNLSKQSGTIQPYQQQPITIAFTPSQPGTYSYKANLSIFNPFNHLYEQQEQLRLEGEGQYPMLIFDRREVILPVVPVGIESIGMFKIINEGYEAISLRYRLVMYDIEGNEIVQQGTGDYYKQQIISNNNSNSNNNKMRETNNNNRIQSSQQSFPEISLIFPEGTKMGINKKDLIVLVKFISKLNSISITCRLEFYDNNNNTNKNTVNNRHYEITLSATCDNSLLTIWPFINDSLNRWRYTVRKEQEEYGNQFKEEQNTNNIIIIESIDTRPPIDKYHNVYDNYKNNNIGKEHFALDCEIARRWINNLLRDEKVGRFPEDVMREPEWLLKLLVKLTGRKEFDVLVGVGVGEGNDNEGEGQGDSNNNNININNNINKDITTTNNSRQSQSSSTPPTFQSKLQFYEHLIKLLKSMGCLLNHIRPEFLLSKEEFLEEMQELQEWEHMQSTYMKYFDVINKEAWLIMFYQIVNNFWYNTGRMKERLKNDNNKNNIKTKLPVNVVSNCYTNTEMTVLRWVKDIYKKYRPNSQMPEYKFLSYTEELKDCIALFYLVDDHITNPQKKHNSLINLIHKPSNKQELLNNTKLFYQLLQTAGINPIIYEEEFQHITEKEMFLFLYQLYETLPQLLPKTEPILFECYLGEKCTKYIEIKNPSNKTVHYWVKLEGSKDFVVNDEGEEEREAIRVEARSVYKFKVCYKSRLSKEQVGYLTFINKLEASSMNMMLSNIGESAQQQQQKPSSSTMTTTTGSTLVFELKSRVIGRKSVKKLEPTTCALYETKVISIPVENYFVEHESGEFMVYLFEEVLEGDGDGGDGKGKDKDKNSTKGRKIDSNNEKSNKNNSNIKMFQLPILETQQEQEQKQEQETTKLTNNNINSAKTTPLQSNNIKQRTINKSSTYISGVDGIVKDNIDNNDEDNSIPLSSTQQSVRNFYTHTSTIKIPKQETAYLELNFSPLIFKKVKCYLIFYDPLVGEFQYEIIGISEIPEVLVEVRHNNMIYTGIKDNIEVNIPVYNNIMMKANLLMEQNVMAMMIATRGGNNNNIKEQQYQNNKSNNNNNSNRFKIQLNMDNKILSHISFPEEFVVVNANKEHYKQLLANRHELVPTMTTIVNEQEMAFINNNNINNSCSTKLKIECLFTTVIKDLCIDFLLVNEPKTDVRRIRVYVNVAHQPIVSELVMKTTARVPIVQPIPIENATDKDWRVKVVLTEDEEGERLGYMSLKEGERLLTREMLIRRKNNNNNSSISSGNICNGSNNIATVTTLTSIAATTINNTNPLSNNLNNNSHQLALIFNPSWTCAINSKLVIHNITTNEQLIYYIKAISEEPLSEGHFVFKSRVNVKEEKVLIVKNPYNETVTCLVESDLGGDVLELVSQSHQQQSQSQLQTQVQSQISHQQQQLLSKVTLPPHGQATIPITIFSSTIKRSIGFVKLTEETKESSSSILSSSKENNNRQRFFWYTIVIDIYEELNDNKEKETVKNLEGEEEKKRRRRLEEHEKQQRILEYKNNKLENEIVGENNRPFNIEKIELKADVNDSAIEVIKFKLPKEIMEVEKELSCVEVEIKNSIEEEKESNSNKGDNKRKYFSIITEQGKNYNENKTSIKILYNHNNNTDIIIPIPIEFHPLEIGELESLLIIRFGHFYERKYLINGYCFNNNSSGNKHNINNKSLQQQQLNSKQQQQLINDRIEGECNKQIIKILKILLPEEIRTKYKNDLCIEKFDKIDILCKNNKRIEQLLMKSWMQIKVQEQSSNNSNYQEKNKEHKFESKQKEQEEELTLICKLLAQQPFEETVEFIITYNNNKINENKKLEQPTIPKITHKVELIIKPPSQPEHSIEIDIPSNNIKSNKKVIKAEINLEHIGVIKMKGQPIKCRMLKNEFVECKFVNNNNNNNNINNNNQSKSPNSIVELTFSLNNNMAFNTNNNKSQKQQQQYTDVLMIYTEHKFWSCEIVFNLKNHLNNNSSSLNKTNK